MAASLLLGMGLLFSPHGVQAVEIAPARALESVKVAQVVLAKVPGVDLKEIEKKISIRSGDVFSHKAIRKEIKKLFKSGKYANVIVWADRRNGKVSLKFRMVPKQRIRALEFSGNSALSSYDLLRAVLFDQDREYTYGVEQEISRAVIRQYEDHGYYDVKIKIKPKRLAPALIKLQVLITEGAPTLISNIKFIGARHFGRLTLGAKFALNKDDVLDRELIRKGEEALQALFIRHRHYQVRIKKTDINFTRNRQEASLTVTIKPGPRYEVIFLGAPCIDRELMIKQIKLKEENHGFSQPVLEELETKLAVLFRRMGYLFARVKASVSAPVKKQGALVRTLLFRVIAGPLVRVFDLRFDGAKHFKQSYLKDTILDLMEDRYPLPEVFDGLDPLELAKFGLGDTDPYREHRRKRCLRWLKPREIYLERNYRQMVKVLVDLYQSHGYLKAEVKKPRTELSRDKRRMTVSFKIKEGVQTKISGFRFRGNRALSSKRLKALFNLKKGDPLDRWKVDKGRESLKKAYMNKGYLFAKVKVEHQFSKKRHRALLFTRITEGRRVRFGTIEIKGNYKTNRLVILDLLTFRPGEYYSTEKIRDSQRILLEMGMFTSANIELVDRKLPETYKNVLVKVHERKPATVELGFGFSLGDGPRGFFRFIHRNIGGYGLRFEFLVKGNYQLFLFADQANRKARSDQLKWYEQLERRISATLYYPRILGMPFPLGIRLDLSSKRRSEISFGLNQLSAVLGLEVKSGRKVAFQLQYEVENSTLKGTYVDDPEAIRNDPTLSDRDKELLLRLDFGTMNIGTLRPIFTIDLRDNPFAPRRGFLSTVTAEYSTTLFSGGANYVKLSGKATGYIPVSSHLVIALQLGVGMIFHISGGSSSPAHKKFFLGGRTTIRGFAEESIIPRGAPGLPARGSNIIKNASDLKVYGEAFLLMKGELRISLTKNLALGIFIDAGNLFWEPRDWSWIDLRVSLGVGLRYQTPVGPLSFDYGYNLRRYKEIGEEYGSFHFSIGLF